MSSSSRRRAPFLHFYYNKINFVIVSCTIYLYLYITNYSVYSMSIIEEEDADGSRNAFGFCASHAAKCAFLSPLFILNTLSSSFFVLNLSLRDEFRRHRRL